LGVIGIPVLIGMAQRYFSASIGEGIITTCETTAIHSWQVAALSSIAL
jgi:hypothetical protein